MPRPDELRFLLSESVAEARVVDAFAVEGFGVPPRAFAVAAGELAVDAFRVEPFAVARFVDLLDVVLDRRRLGFESNPGTMSRPRATTAPAASAAEPTAVPATSMAPDATLPACFPSFFRTPSDLAIALPLIDFDVSCRSAKCKMAATPTAQALASLRSTVCSTPPLFR